MFSFIKKVAKRDLNTVLNSFHRTVTELENLAASHAAEMQRSEAEITKHAERHSLLALEAAKAIDVATNIKKLVSAA